MMSRLLGLIFLCMAVPVFAAEFQQGVHYQKIETGQAVNSAVKKGQPVRVTEMFWYGCQTCFIIQADMQRWLQEQGLSVKYEAVPAVTDDNMLLLARVHYAAQALGVSDKLHQLLFRAIHQHRRKLDTEQAVQTFFAEQGVNAARFNKALNSRFVNSKIRRSQSLAQRYGIRGTPTIIINGRYRVDASMVNSAAQLVEVVAYLVAQQQ